MTSSEIKSLSLGTQSLSQKALWEIAFQVSSVVDILAATEPSKSFDHGEPRDFVGTIVSAELHYQNPAVPPGRVRVTLDVTDAEYSRLLYSQRSKPSEPSTEDSTQPKGEL